MADAKKASVKLVTVLDEESRHVFYFGLPVFAYEGVYETEATRITLKRAVNLIWLKPPAECDDMSRAWQRQCCGINVDTESHMTHAIIVFDKWLSDPHILNLFDLRKSELKMVMPYFAARSMIEYDRTHPGETSVFTRYMQALPKVDPVRVIYDRIMEAGKASTADLELFALKITEAKTKKAPSKIQKAVAKAMRPIGKAAKKYDGPLSEEETQHLVEQDQATAPSDDDMLED